MLRGSTHRTPGRQHRLSHIARAAATLAFRCRRDDAGAMRTSVFRFGDPDRPAPTPEQLRASRRRSGRPTNEMPGTVPVDVLLGHNDDVAVAIGGMHAYTTGLQFDLLIRLREPARSDTGSPRMDLHQQVAGFRRPGGGPDAMLLGFEYPDGQTATNIGPLGGVYGGQVDEDAPALHPGGSSGDDQSFDGAFWLSPLPTGGDLIVVCAWPSRGLPETRAVVEQSLIEAALSRVVELWQLVEEDEQPQPPPPVVLPAMAPGSWFGNVLGEAIHGHTVRP
jgi:hypothetical protein